MSGKVGNYLTTPCRSTKLQKLEYPLRYFRKKNVELASSSTFFVELGVFDNAELKKMGAEQSQTPPKDRFWAR